MPTLGACPTDHARDAAYDQAMIRPYTEADLPAVLDIWYQASVVAHSFLSEDFLARERVTIAEQWMPIAETFIYELDGAAVGFISMIGNEVGAIFVDPGVQNRGIGRSLMDHVREGRPYLELDVFEENALGRRFYDRYGFRFVDVHMNDEAGHAELRLRLD